MPQSPIEIPAGVDGGTFRDSVNDALAAIANGFYGATDPVSVGGVSSRVTEGFFWVDSGCAPPELKIRNPADSGWITIARLTGPDVGANVSGWAASDIGAGISSKLPLAGGTLTGPLVLDDDPATDLEAATKQYVDDNLRPPAVRWFVVGTIGIIAGQAFALIEQACQLTAIYARTVVAPVGDDIIVSIVKNGSGSTQVTIVDGATSGSNVLGSPIALAVGDYLRMDIVSVGTTTPGGAPLMVSCLLAAP